MIVRGIVKKGAYYDSITLMRVSQAIAGLQGVGDAAVVMGTTTNKAVLRASGLYLPEFEAAGDTDLLIAVKAETSDVAERALVEAEARLREAGRKRFASETAPQPASLESALRLMPDANLVLISVAGRYAGALAMEALERGLHVMLFSDNVPLETEIELKRYARDRGLLVMGPDCGTALINGAPLAFANVVPRGAIGIVAAAGTGLQEVSCLIAAEGEGVSQGVGTGGRDVKKAVGGIMFLEALRALAAHKDTEIILLVSKPPDGEVRERIEAAIREQRKPVVALFLGEFPEEGPCTLEEAAAMAVALRRKGSVREAMARLRARDAELEETAIQLARRLTGRKFARGLFSGGTLCSEAQVIFRRLGVAGVTSNVPTAGATRLADSLRSEGHAMVDFGEDEFTVGRPHPMIDFSLRNRRILAEAADPEVAVILLDVVLGYGAHPDPAAELAPVIREAARRVAVVCSVTGTDRDPQNRARVVRALEEAGAVVCPSNAAAATLTAFIVRCLGGAR